LKIAGAKNALQRQDKKLCLCQKFLLTKEEDNTNVQNAGKNLGYKLEDHLQKQFIDQNCDQKSDRFKNNVDGLCISWCNFV
jgi:hypothetical protein